MLAYAHVCARMRTYADMLTYAQKERIREQATLLEEQVCNRAFIEP